MGAVTAGTLKHNLHVSNNPSSRNHWRGLARATTPGALGRPSSESIYPFGPTLGQRILRLLKLHILHSSQTVPPRLLQMDVRLARMCKTVGKSSPFYFIFYFIFSSCAFPGLSDYSEYLGKQCRHKSQRRAFDSEKNAFPDSPAVRENATVFDYHQVLPYCSLLLFPCPPVLAPYPILLSQRVSICIYFLIQRQSHSGFQMSWL